jgi:NAD(P)-dependent dehydrogenase (short-subunit alcohol dehydrogenase family)
MIMQSNNQQEEIREKQQQEKPGAETKMKPEPIFDNPEVKGCGRLNNKIAFITGADSGIGKAVAVLFAKEGADIVDVYLCEHEDAKLTQKAVEQYGRKCLSIAGDISDENFCRSAVEQAVKEFGRIDILVNNAATQTEQKNFEDITTEQLVKTYQTNIFSMFWITKAALPNMKQGSTIINSTSVTAYRGSSSLIDYASTKGAIVGFTRSLASNLVEKGIRVNAVAPGPIWTPLIVSTFDPEKTAKHGSDTPMKRAGEPVEVAPSYLFLASNDFSSYITGQVIHPNGGEIVNA